MTVKENKSRPWRAFRFFRTDTHRVASRDAATALVRLAWPDAVVKVEVRMQYWISDGDIVAEAIAASSGPNWYVRLRPDDHVNREIVLK
jgi:hypothetical protein